MPDYDHSFFTPKLKGHSTQNKDCTVKMYCEVLALEGSLKPSLTKVFAKFWTEDLPYSDISQISSQNLIVEISLHFYAFWLHFVINFII